MDITSLQETAKALVTKQKGILAADESNHTAKKRLEAIGVEDTEENHRRYRDLFLSTPGAEKYLSGVILYDETIHQKADDGTPFPELLQKKGIIPGIKVDGGTKPFPGFPNEEITEGLDGLRERLTHYYSLGARFAKWRAVIRIGDGIPTPELLHTNAIILARYARLCQEEGIVPMVEPEVLLEGSHTIEQSEEVTRRIVSEVMYQLGRYRVDLSAVILKTSMVLPGKETGHADPETVGEATVRMLKAAVPNELAGVVFLSGGQEPEEATANLNAVAEREPLPWEITFSYARALQQPVLDVWHGKDENKEVAQDMFLKRLALTIAADSGTYTEDMESAA